MHWSSGLGRWRCSRRRPDRARRLRTAAAASPVRRTARPAFGGPGVRRAATASSSPAGVRPRGPSRGRRVRRPPCRHHASHLSPRRHRVFRKSPEDADGCSHAAVAVSELRGTAERTKAPEGVRGQGPRAGRCEGLRTGWRGPAGRTMLGNGTSWRLHVAMPQIYVALQHCTRGSAWRGCCASATLRAPGATTGGRGTLPDFAGIEGLPLGPAARQWRTGDGKGRGFAASASRRV